jgi:regulator of protease activity HflC (stomatin/prohibitin superfamily)
MIGLGIAGLVAIILLFGTSYNIDQGDRGVILCNGAICGEADAGFHLKAPLIQDVAELNFRSQPVKFTISTPTVDKQLATVDVVVTWRPLNATRIYSDYKNIEAVQDQIVQPKSRELVGAEVGKITSTQAINGRETVSAAFERRLTQVIAKTGVAVVTSAQITHIQLPGPYMDAVNDTLKAQVAVQTAKANYESEKIKADIEAYKKTAAGDAEARAIKARGDALRENPGLPGLIEAEAHLTAAQRWDKKLPNVMVSGGSVPMLNLGK